MDLWIRVLYHVKWPLANEWKYEWITSSVSLGKSNQNFFTLAEAIVTYSTCESVYVKDCEFRLFLLINDIVEAHCYVVDNCKS